MKPEAEHIWQAALKQAQRSPMKRFRCGAVIYRLSGDKEIVAAGCNYRPEGKRRLNTVHAEQMAIANAKARGNFGGCACFVVAINSSGNLTYSSRPCRACALALSHLVWGVTYVQKANDGSMMLVHDDPKQMVARSHDLHGEFAKDLRVPPISR